MSGFFAPGPGPLAPPFDFNEPLPLLRREFAFVFDVGGTGTAVCHSCKTLFNFSIQTEGWALRLIEHTRTHEQLKAVLAFVPKTTLARAPKVKRRAPSTPFDLQTADLFKE